MRGLKVVDPAAEPDEKLSQSAVGARIGDPPMNSGPAITKIWRRLASEWGSLVRFPDREAIRLYCSLKLEADELEAMLHTEGYFDEDGSPSPVNALLSERRRQMAGLLKSLGVLGSAGRKTQ